MTAFSYLLFFLWIGTIVCSTLLFWHEKKQRHANQSQVGKDIKEEISSFETDSQTVTSAQDKLDSNFVDKKNSPISNEDSSQSVSHCSPPSIVNMTYSPLIHEPNSPYEGLQRPITTIIAPYTPSPLVMSPP